ncbi:MAG: prepilin peptidase [Planctomycetes bacterium]|nr:prepilin peptidase [Planctomycetota bacterium]
MENSPSTWRRTLDQGRASRPQLEGLDVYAHRLRGSAQRLSGTRHRLRRRAKRVLDLGRFYQDLSNDALRETAVEMRTLFRCRQDKATDLERAFALIREVAVRQLGEKHYLVQVMGGFALAQGSIAEMATGEGKTLCATLPATVAGWRGMGCHIITVNDYLAERDAQWMGRIYSFCGVRSDFVHQGMEPHARKYAYQADVTYCTNKEVTADFLRDRIILGPNRDSNQVLLARIVGTQTRRLNQVVQRGLNYAIVDEADSVLIDEAVTPLIISGPAPNTEQLDAYRQAATLAKTLSLNVDYVIDMKYREIKLTPKGRRRLEDQTAALGGLWRVSRRAHEMVTKALTATAFYRRDKQYVVDEQKVVIVDDFTGRLMPDRSWRDGLHQAVEAKEGLELTPVKDTLARISFQRFFRLYRKLAGMTGTAIEASQEFWSIYHLPVITIPYNRPCLRRQLPEVIVQTEAEKWDLIVEEIATLHAAGRPVLIGTRSVQASEHLSRLLKDKQLDHQVLNAVRHKEEASIVSLAGQQGRITVATNIAGRGTDIKLGPQVKALGGLHVLSADKNESDRIDRQLFGRCARQGDPGSSSSVVSLEDELIRRHAPKAYQRLTRWKPLTAKGLFRTAQHRAQRTAQQQRRHVVRSDQWLDQQLGFTHSL